MKKILLIEDEKILREMYIEKLNKEGFDVRWANSAEEGIKIVKEENFDLILLDILLPQANGIQFLKEIKKIPQKSEIPIVAFSNYDDAKTKKEAAALGVKEYLIKTNYTPKEIIEKIKKYLQ